MDGNKPAYPVKRMEDNGRGYGKHEVEYSGITKREYFAAKAMQGIMACPEPDAEWDATCVAENAVKQADALIAALNKEEKQ